MDRGRRRSANRAWKARAASAAAGLLLAVTTGCATTGDVDRLEQRLDAVEGRLTAVEAKASAAEQSASAAQQAADRAARDAAEAAQRADDAARRAEAIFNKSVSK